MENELSTHTAEELKQELPEGLRVFAETAWGWSELKAAAFVKRLQPGAKVTAYCEVRKNGAITLKIPRRV